MKSLSILLVATCLVVTNLPKKAAEPLKATSNDRAPTPKFVKPKKTPSKPIALESKPDPLKVKKEIDNYQPSWDVEGDYSKALDRQSLIVHLNGQNHRFTMEKLNAMSTDDLQKLHDEDHEKMNKNNRYYKAIKLWRLRR